jgi:hypothetical protein
MSTDSMPSEWRFDESLVLNRLAYPAQEDLGPSAEIRKGTPATGLFVKSGVQLFIV